MSNAQVTRDVLDELLWDNSIHADRITVAADNGRVTLGGVVDHYYEKWNSVEAAGRVVGVTSVVDAITVDTDKQRVLDADLAVAARQGLAANGLVPDGAIKV